MQDTDGQTPDAAPAPSAPLQASLPAELRPRELMERFGCKSLSDDQLLAILLRSGTRGLNVVELSRAILRRYGSLRELSKATPAELEALGLPGLGRVKCLELSAALEITRRVLDWRDPDERMDSPENVARRLAIFDPDWLLETGREDDFRMGLGGLSNHLYVRSLSGGWRRWACHCAWNRMPGATLVRDPWTDNPPPGTERSVREVLQLARVRDPRLVSERQGIVWNFPASRRGVVAVECRIVGAGFRLTLSDHWMNPCDETVAGQSPFSRAIGRDDVPDDGWHTLSAGWDEDRGSVELRIDERPFASGTLAMRPSFGLSYLHLQTLADDADPEGTYIRRLRKM